MLKSGMSTTGRSLVRAIQYNAGIFNKRKPTKKDLDQYDVVVIGCNLGGILSRQFDKVTKGKYKVMVVLDQNVNQMTQIRNIYEQQKLAKTDYLLNAKMALNMYTANSELVGAQQILPEENTVVLRNGRKIAYNHLVVAMGMPNDLESIKGFDEAWKDQDHHVFANLDHPTWRASHHKYCKWHYNHNHGQGYFCIPQYPFSGEVEAYNFFLTNKIWNQQISNGRQSPISDLTIINANDKFVQYSESGDYFFKEELKKRNIKVEYGLKLVGVNKETNTATFEDVQTGKQQDRPYNSLYQIAPTKPNDVLVSAGLTTTRGLLDVDIETLRHKKYQNIFGLGDVVDVPTTKAFWAGFHQLHVVRTNLERSLHGQSLIAKYDGYSKIPILLGQNTVTYLAHKYNDQNLWHSLYFSNGGFLASLRYYNWVKNFKKAFLDIYLEKNYGPPYYRFKKSFSAPDQEKQGGILQKILPAKH
ncbi:hypothetical protein pb186bvf_016313 [Paramecium bursaria]